MRASWRLVSAVVALALGLLVLAECTFGEPEQDARGADVSGDAALRRATAEIAALRAGFTVLRASGVIVSWSSSGEFTTAIDWPNDTRVLSWRARRGVAEARLHAIAEEVGKYPDALLRGRLHAIVVVRWLRYGDTELGGVWRDGTVFVTDETEDGERSDRGFRQVLHAEISSVLVRSRAGRELWSWADWTDASGGKGSYGTGGGDAIRSGRASTRWRSVSHERGFLTEYGASSPENDLNDYWSVLMRRPLDLEKVAAEYPLVRKKAARVRALIAALSEQPDGSTPRPNWLEDLIERRELR